MPQPERATWARVTVKQTGHVRIGAARSPARLHNGRLLPYLRAGNIGDRGQLDLDVVHEMEFSVAERPRYRLRPGDLVLAEGSGSPDQVGRSAIWQGGIEECCFQNSVIRYRPWATSPQFAALLFRHMQKSGMFADIARGSGIRHLTTRKFADIAFDLPPLDEQEAIATVGSQRLERVARARDSLMNALSKNNQRVSEILSLATDGALIDNPEMEAWVRRKIADVGDVLIGRARSPQRAQGDHMRPYLRVANVQEGRIDVDDVLEMNFEPDEFERFALREGDILLNEGQSPELVGRAAIFRGEVPGASFQNSLLRFRAHDSFVPEYALIVFRSYLREGVFKRVAKWSTGIAHLTQRRFVELEVPVPPVPVQLRIVAEAERLLAQAQADQDRIQRAISDLDGVEVEVLALAVSGELTRDFNSVETATDLLARLGPPKENVEQLVAATADSGESAGRRIETVTKSLPDEHTRLRDILVQASRPLPLTELFQTAGYDRNSVEDVEKFYLRLRAEIRLGLIFSNSAGISENQEFEAACSADS